jgi:hypothetical protein
MGAPWLQPVAISRKSTECRSGRNKPKPLPWVATSCRSERMVEEGVSGSSPEEGSAKAPHVGAFSFMPTCAEPNVRWVWSRIWSFRADEASRWATMGPTRHRRAPEPHPLLASAGDQRPILRTGGDSR